jgi:hypothetical protein
MTSLPLAVVWRCGVIALIPLLVWALQEPRQKTIWQRAGNLHYQVRYTPGAEKACLILMLKDITPGLKPMTCRD